jgi:hypothetical protein
MHGKQQQMVAHNMKGIAYPMQLKVSNAIHNLYKLGASCAADCPPKIQTLPTTNQIAKKQSRAILNLSTNIPILSALFELSEIRCRTPCVISLCGAGVKVT